MLKKICKNILNVFIYIVAIFALACFLILPFFHNVSFMNNDIKQILFYASIIIIIIYSLFKKMLNTKNHKINMLYIIIIFLSIFILNYYDTLFTYEWFIFEMMCILYPYGCVTLLSVFDKNNVKYNRKTVIKKFVNYVPIWLCVSLFLLAFLKDYNILFNISGWGTVLCLFYMIAMSFLSNSKDLKILLLFDFILGVLMTILLIYSIKDVALQQILCTIISAIFGGILTLVGVAWTIKQSNLDKKESVKLSIKPYIYLLHYLKDKYDYNDVIETCFGQAHYTSDDYIRLGCIKNSDNGILIFKKIILGNKNITVDYGSVLEKGKMAEILLCMTELSDFKEFMLICTDVQNNEIKYKCYLGEDKFINKIEEV